jgi:hypothetical protein
MIPLTDYPMYSITKDGKVWSSRTNKFLATQKTNKGYECVSLTIKGKSVGKHIHRLVAIAFIPNPDNKPFVNHLDNNPMNNCISNLEWCTQSENMIHSAKQGRMSNHRGAKLSEKSAKEIISRASEPTSDLAAEFGVCPATIRCLLRQETWKHLFVGELQNINFQNVPKGKSFLQKSRKYATLEPKKLSNSDVEKIMINEENLSRRELANKFEVSKTYINHLFNGRARCYITYKFGITPKKWPKETPFPEGVDTSNWRCD